MKSFIQKHISWLLCALFALTAIFTVLFCYEMTEKIKKDNLELSSYYNELSNTHIEYLRHLANSKDAMAEKDAFMNFGQHIIAKFYSTHYQTDTYIYLTPPERIELLKTIYDQSLTFQTFNLSAAEIRIMCLAYCRVESEFNGFKSLKSQAGAKGLFQFMDATAQMVCKRLDLVYSKSIAYDVATSVRLWFYYYTQIKSKYTESPWIEEYTAIEYNSGRNDVWHSINTPPEEFLGTRLAETRNYYPKILSTFNEYSKQYSEILKVNLN